MMAISRRLKDCLLAFVSMFLFATGAAAQESDSAPVDSAAVDSTGFLRATAARIPAPPVNADAKDTPSDEGHSITVFWELSSDDRPGEGFVTGYRVLRAKSPDGPFSEAGFSSAGETRYTDASTHPGTDFYYKVETQANGASASSPVIGPVRSSAQWFNFNILNLFIVGGIISLFIGYFIASAKKGKKLFIRKIAGLEAVDEAIGRATEMGRPILFIPGIQDMDDVQTVAGITILGRIARTIAEYDSKLYVPTARSIVMTTARESIKEAYLSAGRPDAYSDDLVQYVTDEQFGYVAAVDGIMVREKPATCFYLGAFFAESLIMAETGHSIGAIQIAGTAMPAQLPFFVAACDYTLIGEELFAASAYLSHEPRQLGSLKGQDVGKMIAMLAILAGVGLLTIGSLFGFETATTAGEWVRDLFKLNQ
jgi:hypothetical protein